MDRNIKTSSASPSLASHAPNVNTITQKKVSAVINERAETNNVIDRTIASRASNAIKRCSRWDSKHTALIRVGVNITSDEIEIIAIRVCPCFRLTRPALYK